METSPRSLQGLSKPSLAKMLLPCLIIEVPNCILCQGESHNTYTSKQRKEIKGKKSKIKEKHDKNTRNIKKEEKGETKGKRAKTKRRKQQKGKEIT